MYLEFTDNPPYSIPSYSFVCRVGETVRLVRRRMCRQRFAGRWWLDEFVVDLLDRLRILGVLYCAGQRRLALAARRREPG
jgi:hypothetical protein